MSKGRTIHTIVGSYADASGPGLYVCEYNEERGSLTVVDRVSGLANPTFAVCHAESSRVYSIMEEKDGEGNRIGAAAAFELDRSTGRLTPLGSVPTLHKPTCHITLDRSGSSIVVSSYHGASLGLFPLEKDGRISRAADIHVHEGRSVLPVQDRPRVHSVFFDRNNRFAVACDLGLDKLFVYRLTDGARRLEPHGSVSVSPGSGPRHFAFHPSLPFGYVINELNGTVTCFAWNAEEGRLVELETVPTLPAEFEGENATADIHISPDGRFLYGSNRGHDSIVVYRIDPSNGCLALVEHASTLGGHPRNFALSPDGRFVLVANRDGNHIVTFARDTETGKLTPTGDELALSMPVCIAFCV